MQINALNWSTGRFSNPLTPDTNLRRGLGRLAIYLIIMNSISENQSAFSSAARRRGKHTETLNYSWEIFLIWLIHSNVMLCHDFIYFKSQFWIKILANVTIGHADNMPMLRADWHALTNFFQKYGFLLFHHYLLS